MTNIREMLGVELAKLVAAKREIEVALEALSNYSGVPGTAAKSREPRAKQLKFKGEPRAKRVDSPQTTARKRVASAKRFGKAPDEADVALAMGSEQES
jgi:hypothetical protein